MEFILKRVSVQPNGCWLWTGNKTTAGYGRIHKHGTKGNYVTAHRVVYFKCSGTAPVDKEVCHKCDTPSCVNPDHLWLGSHYENMQDARVKGRMNQGSNNGQARLTAAQVTDMITKRQNGATLKDLSLEFGVQQSQVSRICNGKRWGKFHKDKNPNGLKDYKWA